MKKPILTRWPIITVAVILSIIIYVTGVFSGLYANKIIEKKVEEDIAFLKSYMDISSVDLKNMLLLQLLTDRMRDECRFLDLYLTSLRSQLEPYWQKLPSRLEEYDRTGKATEEYNTLKREYIRLSLRIWLIARKNYERCSSNLIPILYFYSKDCDTCVRQGEIFDELGIELEKTNKSLVVFPIDKDFEDDSVFLLKQYYNITFAPSVVIKDKLVTADIIPIQRLINEIGS